MDYGELDAYKNIASSTSLLARSTQMKTPFASYPAVLLLSKRYSHVKD
jgi:hypothetical protein